MTAKEEALDALSTALGISKKRPLLPNDAALIATSLASAADAVARIEELKRPRKATTPRAVKAVPA